MNEPIEMTISGSALSPSPTLSAALKRQGFSSGGTAMYFGDDFFYYHPPEGTPGYDGLGWEFSDDELLAEVRPEEQETSNRPPPTNADPAPPEIVEDTDETLAIGLAPDFVRTGDKVVPYSSHAVASDDQNYAGTVRSNGRIVHGRDGRIAITRGAEPGNDNGGVKSRTEGGKRSSRRRRRRAFGSRANGCSAMATAAD